MSSLRRTTAAAALLVAGAAALGCSATPAAPTAAGPSTVSAADLPLFEALGRAVEAREDETAWSLLQRIRDGDPQGRALELADGYERILAGRAAVAGLELALALRPEPGTEPGAPGRVRVVLVARHSGDEPILLRTGPATLGTEQTIVDARGREEVASASESFDRVRELELPSGETREVELGARELALPPGALAARWRWSLVMRSGEVVVGARALPATRVAVHPVETTLLAGGGGSLPVEPEALALSLENPSTGAREALALAVQVEPARRAEALDRLAPVVAALPDPSLARLVPALRWLAPANDLGGDPRAWRAWMSERAQRRAEPGGKADLDLPRARREASAPRSASGSSPVAGTLGDGER